MGFPASLLTLIDACSANYTHGQATGEDTGLPAGFFVSLFVYNVLNHCQNVEAIMKKAHRLLMPGGRIFIACDVVSAAAEIRFHLWAKH